MLKVVIIDANAISRNLLGTVLTNGGHQVIGDSNASSAGVAKMIKLQPQMVCVDIGPISTESMEILDTIHNALPKALLFMVSGNIDSTTVQGALERGVHGFIIKPFNAGSVLKTVRNAVLKLVKQQQARIQDRTE